MKLIIALLNLKIQLLSPTHIFMSSLVIFFYVLEFANF